LSGIWSRLCGRSLRKERERENFKSFFDSTISDHTISHEPLCSSRSSGNRPLEIARKDIGGDVRGEERREQDLLDSSSSHFPLLPQVSVSNRSVSAIFRRFLSITYADKRGTEDNKERKLVSQIATTGEQREAHRKRKTDERVTGREEEKRRDTGRESGM